MKDFHLLSFASLPGALGFGSLGSSGKDEMLMQDAAGDFEVYQYNAGLNAFVGNAMGAVGAPWVVDGIAANPTSGMAGADGFAPYQSASDAVAGGALQGPLDPFGFAPPTPNSPDLRSPADPLIAGQFTGTAAPAAEMPASTLAGSDAAAMLGANLFHHT